MRNLNSLLEDNNKKAKAPLDEKQIGQFRSAVEKILAKYHNDEYNMGFSIADWDDKDPETEDNNSMYHFRYIPESGEEGTADYQSERFEFTISGGLNGAGHWEDYLKELSEIFDSIEDETGWEPVAIKMENDVCDDLFDVQVAVYNVDDIKSTAESLKEGCWNMPTTVAEANKLKKLMSHKVDAFSVGDCYCANDELGIGDDTLFDEIGKWRQKYGYGSKKSNDCRKVIRDFIKNNVLPGWDNYTYASPEGNADGKVWEPGVKEIYQEIADMKLNESFNDGLDEDIEKHDELNPKLFEGNKLKPDVVDKINEIVDAFLESLAEDDIKIKVDDIILVGSNVSYNYTKDSDLDIHILADTSQLDCPDNLYPLLYGAYKSLFNRKMNINFYGIPVEVYVETDDTPLRSNGIYSVKDNDWIKEPDQESIPEIDNDKVNELVQPYEDRFNEIKENPSVEAIDQLITDIYDERKEGMSKEDGEYSYPNLCFKEFRNRGYLDQLKDLRAEVLSKDLSLESLHEDVMETSKQVIAKQLGVPYETAVADIKKMIEDALEWEDMPIVIDALEIYGSRRFGKPKETSDLDVALFYHSADEDDRVREDDLFNCLNSGFGDEDDYDDDYDDEDDEDEDDEYGDAWDDSEYDDTYDGHMYYRGYPLDINPHEDFTPEEIKNYMLRASTYKKEETWLASMQHPLDERLSNSDIYSYRIKLQQITGHQGLVFNNGHFTINNIREDEVDQILSLLNREKKFIKNCHKIASGKWDFNHMKFMNMPSRYYTINGEFNID